MGKSLAFTGHRPESLPFGENELSASSIRLKALLLDEIMASAAQGYGRFYCGMTRGADMIFGEQVLWVKATAFPELRLIAVIPHEEQANNWPERWRDRYFSLLEKVDDAVLISQRYAPGCYHRQNRYMVDHADALLTVYDGSGKGGSAYTIAYARKQGTRIVRIDPNTLERTSEPPQTI